MPLEPADLDIVDAPAQEEMNGHDGEKHHEDECCTCCILSGPRLDEDSILKHGRWCCYCCCCGVGGLKETHSPCHCLIKCCTWQHVCEMVEHENREGYVGCMETCCYCTPMLQLPPPEGTPHCKCCNTICCGIKRSEADKTKERGIEDDPMTRFESTVFDQRFCCFFQCCGCSCEPFFQTVYDAYWKCFCCRCSDQCLLPCEEKGTWACCLILINAGYCVSQCRYPMKFEQNPVCALFGKRFKHHTSSPPGAGLA